MLKINFLEALLYPLRNPGRFLRALWLFLSPQLLAGGLTAVTVGGVVSLGLLPQHHTKWLIAQHSLTDWLMGGALVLLVAALVILVLGAALGGGYWMRVLRSAAGGERQLPALEGRLWMLLEGLRAGVLVLLITALPTAFALYCLRGLSFGSLAGWRLFLSVLGSSLTTCLAVLSLLAAGVVANMACLRLATAGNFLRALNPLGIARDIRRGWADYFLCYLALLIGILLPHPSGAPHLHTLPGRFALAADGETVEPGAVVGPAGSGGRVL